ncbi:MAG: sigma-70 family RNA polymerase sigma factor [Proteobacteria bacterium]|nr:sigma-70 family RNA polymerase sigma factor [Pseudomonadota bacterium]
MSSGNFFSRVEMNNLYRYGYALCSNQDDAYDLLQYALEKYLHKSDRYNDACDLAYVRTTMRNRFIDEYRKSARFPEEEYDDGLLVVIDETALEDVVVAQIDLEIMWKELNTMEREVLYYWAIEGMTAQEIAEQIDVARGTVLSRLYRIRKKFDTKAEINELSGGRGA